MDVLGLFSFTVNVHGYQNSSTGERKHIYYTRNRVNGPDTLLSTAFYLGHIYSFRQVDKLPIHSPCLFVAYI